MRSRLQQLTTTIYHNNPNQRYRNTQCWAGRSREDTAHSAGRKMVMKMLNTTNVQNLAACEVFYSRFLHPSHTSIPHSKASLYNPWMTPLLSSLLTSILHSKGNGPPITSVVHFSGCGHTFPPLSSSAGLSVKNLSKFPHITTNSASVKS
jgi:hypothetical protein